jgi:hypothetical protein
MGTSEQRMATRHTVLVIWCAVFAGALGLTVVAAILGPGIWSRVSDNGEVVAWVVFAVAVAAFLGSRVLTNRIKPTPGATVESMAVGRSIIATGLNGGVALQAPLAWMVSGKMVALIALAISLSGLLLVMPSQRRWQKLRRAIVATFGQALATGANISMPRIPVSRAVTRAVMGLMFALAVLSAAVVALAYNEFWTHEVLRRPANPITRPLMLLALALMMIVLAVMRFIGASTSRRPRWQRAYGFLLVLFAAFLFVLLALMV